jgi:hypothetical protein
MVDGLLAELRWVELERAVLVQSLANLAGLSSSAHLDELAAAMPPPWNEVLEDHRRALVDVVHQMEEERDDSSNIVELPSTVVDLRLQAVLHPPSGVGGRVVRPSLLEFLGETA